MLGALVRGRPLLLGAECDSELRIRGYFCSSSRAGVWGSTSETLAATRKQQ
jgi:hypothetical protein